MSDFEFRTVSFDLKLRHTFRISRSARDAQTNVFLRIRKGGHSGYGEAGPNTRYNETAEKVLGYMQSVQEVLQEDLRPEDLQDRLRSIEEKKGLQALYSARFALETAYLDWYCRSQSRSVAEYLGVSGRETPPSSYTIGIDEIPVMQQKVKERPDFEVYKIKLGSGRDREIIRGIREVTDKPIRVDANEGWRDPDTAKREIDHLYDQGVEMVEQPMPADMAEEMIRLKEWSPIPLCADESFTSGQDLEHLREGFDVINIKLNKSGSLIDSLHDLRKAQELGLEVMIGCMLESSLGIGAGALLAAEADYADLDGHILISNDPFSGMKWSEDRRLILPEGPGLGLLPNESALF